MYVNLIGVFLNLSYDGGINNLFVILLTAATSSYIHISNFYCQDSVLIDITKQKIFNDNAILVPV